MTSEKITLSVAAKALGVSVRTVQRYLDKGLITRVKQDGKVYVIADEIRGLRAKAEATKNTADDSGKNGKATITVDMAYLEGLLVQIGEMKEKQRLLLEYKDDIRQKELSLLAKDEQLLKQTAEIEHKNKELSEAKDALNRANQELRRAIQIKQDAEEQRARAEARERELKQIQAENERLKKRSFFQRLFNK